MRFLIIFLIIVCRCFAYSPMIVDSNTTVSNQTVQFHYLNLDLKSNITFVNVNFINFGLIRGASAKNIKFINCKFDKLSPDCIIFIELGLGNDNWTFEHCEISNCPNGIYSRIGANYITITDSYFHDIGVGIKKDGHAIGIQEGVGHKIIGNRIERIGGTAICCWSGLYGILKYTTISGNVINDVKSNPGASGSGIEISCKYDVGLDLPIFGARYGNSVCDNKISNCDGNGFRYACARDPIILKNNIYSNCKKGNIYIMNPFSKLAAKEWENYQ